jgi:hypothetical protein
MREDEEESGMRRQEMSLGKLGEKRLLWITGH